MSTQRAIASPVTDKLYTLYIGITLNTQTIQFELNLQLNIVTLILVVYDSPQWPCTCNLLNSIYYRSLFIAMVNARFSMHGTQQVSSLESTFTALKKRENSIE
mgnify:CR=1 FL=1